MWLIITQHLFWLIHISPKQITQQHCSSHHRISARGPVDRLSSSCISCSWAAAHCTSASTARLPPTSPSRDCEPPHARNSASTARLPPPLHRAPQRISSSTVSFFSFSFLFNKSEGNSLLVLKFEIYSLCWNLFEHNLQLNSICFRGYN